MTQQLANIDQLMAVLRRATNDDSDSDRVRELLLGVLRRNIEDLHHAEPIIRYDAHDCLIESLSGICTEIGMNLDYLRETIEKYYLNYDILDWLMVNDRIYTAFCDGEYVGLWYQASYEDKATPEGFLVSWEYDYAVPDVLDPKAIPAPQPPVIHINKYRG